MGVSGVPGAESGRSVTPTFAWHERWERAAPNVTDGPVRRVAPATDTTPGAGRGTGPPGPPITTDFVPDMGADGTPPVSIATENDDSRPTHYGASGRLTLSSGLQPTLVDRRA